MTSEWVEWHRQYGEASPLAERLAIVQEMIRRALAEPFEPPFRAISICSGDGRDLIGAVHHHSRAQDVQALLVDTDPELVARGRRHAEASGLPGFKFVLGDASVTTVYSGFVPANLVLACGIFGNVTDTDVMRTIGHFPELCARNGTVIWTRGRFEPDLTPKIRAQFRSSGFEELAFIPIPQSTGSVGAAQLTGRARPFRPGEKLFTFLPKPERPSQIAEERTSATPSTLRRERRKGGRT